ncbi:hypothetical protein [Rubrivirga sp.]|uniref:hypothetical protein n=1 Tax=Rubrivirga sp. TaxID=1885344 RepID=UPI003B51830B
MTRSHVPALQRALSAHEAAPTARMGAHLADYSFRFDTDAPPTSAPRPTGPGTGWTLAETLRELRLRNTGVVPTTRGLRVRHAHRVPELAAAVRTHADAVGLWLDLGRPAPTGGWDDEVAFQAAWLDARLGTPPTPLALRPGVAVTDWARFRASVGGALAQGPDAPSAATLRRDLADLFAGHARFGVRPVPRRRPARAA